MPPMCVGAIGVDSVETESANPQEGFGKARMVRGGTHTPYESMIEELSTTVLLWGSSSPP